MVIHIVMWNFKSEVAEEKKEALKEGMKVNLEGLVGQVPGLLEASYVAHPLPGTTHDMALITSFDSEVSLKGYKNHPSHVHVADTFVRPYTTNRACLNFNK